MDLEDSEKSLYEAIEKLDTNKVQPRDYADQEHLFDTKTTYPIVTDADHEIVVEISMTLLKRNSENPDAMPETTPLYSNNYWIPLQSGVNANEYSNAFLNHFQNAITGSI